MTYQEIDFITPIIDFVKTCPFLKTEDKISSMAFNPEMILQGNTLAYTGTPKPIWAQDVLGDVFVTKQANFILYVRRFSKDEVSRKEIAKFLPNFEAWVEHENIFGTPPKFGNKDYRERIWADNGMFLEVTENKDITDYMIQIHIDYQILYKDE